MANPSRSLTTLSRTLYKSIISNQQTHKPFTSSYKSFFSTDSNTSSSAPPEYNSDLDGLPLSSSDSETESPPTPPPPPPPSSSSPPQETGTKFAGEYKLEDGLDVGIYKAVIVGQVGQSPVQKRLKNGTSITLTTVGTGGIRNERIPFPNEEPGEYANRCNIQWHRVAIYPQFLGDTVMKTCKPGSVLYLEGNLETKIFTDNVSGDVRRVREIAIRGNGRVVFLGNGGDFKQPSMTELRGIGYY